MMPRRRIRPLSSEQRLSRLSSLLIICPFLLSVFQVLFALRTNGATRAIHYVAAAIFYLAMVVMLLGVVALDLPPLARLR